MLENLKISYETVVIKALLAWNNNKENIGIK
jgi:hypothetical protein